MRRIMFVLGASVALAGCSSNAFFDRPATLGYRGGKATAALAEEAALTAYHGDDSARGGQGRQQFRDAFVRRELAADEDSFNDFVRRLRSGRAGFNIASDGALLTLNGISAVTGGAATKAALAAASGGIVGIRGSVDKELFNQEALSAFIVRMKAARLAALASITEGLAKSDGQYPLEQALIDLRAYAEAGTLSGTLSAITKDAGAEAQQATERLETVTRGTDYRDTMNLRATLQQRLAKLSDAQISRLTLLMEGSLNAWPAVERDEILAINPSRSRLTDVSVARKFLEQWLDVYGETPDLLKIWSANLDITEK